MFRKRYVAPFPKPETWRTWSFLALWGSIGHAYQVLWNGHYDRLVNIAGLAGCLVLCVAQSRHKVAIGRRLVGFLVQNWARTGKSESFGEDFPEI